MQTQGQKSDKRIVVLLRKEHVGRISRWSARCSEHGKLPSSKDKGAAELLGAVHIRSDHLGAGIIRALLY